MEQLCINDVIFFKFSNARKKLRAYVNKAINSESNPICIHILKTTPSKFVKDNSIMLVFNVRQKWEPYGAVQDLG